MGIEKIDTRTVAASGAWSSIPDCSSVPPAWKGEWVQVPTANDTPGTTVYTNIAPASWLHGSWLHVFCAADNPGSNRSGNTGNTGAG